MEENVQTEVVEEVKTTEEVEETKATEEVKSEKTFTRSDLSKIMAAEKEKWQAELENEKTQAEKLAKMNAEEKIAFERDNLQKELEELRGKQAQVEMTKTARAMLAEVDIAIADELLDTLVTADAEETKTRVDAFAKSFKDEVDKAVKEALKGKVAKKPASAPGLTKESILAVPDRSERLRLIAANQGLFN